MSRRRWTLRRTLVVGAGLLVAAGLAVTCVATVLALRSFAYERLDQQVLESAEFAIGPRGPGGGPGGGDDGGPAQRVGSLVVIIQDDEIASATYTRDDGSDVPLTDAQEQAIESTAFVNGDPVTIDLGGDLGQFRVAQKTSGDVRAIGGISLADLTATSTALTVILVFVAATTLLLVMAGLSIVVGRTLRPLDRVAAVAQRVADRELADGEGTIPERVEDADTDPVTEVGRVGNALNTLLGHVESSLAARHRSEERLRRFIADASHELRTPLASIGGYAQLSQSEGAPMTPTQERSFEQISAEATRMGSLVEDLLLLARLDAGQPLRNDPVDLTLLVIDAVSDAHAADAERTWLLDVTGDEALVTGDENRIRQVIANLLRNARTHTPPGTVVTTSLAIDDDAALIRVADDGPGIDPAVRDRLFERFARGDEARNRDAGSTGLGLSIADAIVSAHGGTLGVESEPGRTVFTVRLPR